MKRLIRDEEGNVAVLRSVGSMRIPPGWTLVSDEETASEELSLARKSALARIRARRDAMLVQNDKLWLIASKKGEPTTALEADAQLLRDLPEGAASDLEALVMIAGIESYDPFPSLGLSQEY